MEGPCVTTKTPPGAFTTDLTEPVMVGDVRRYAAQHPELKRIQLGWGSWGFDSCIFARWLVVHDDRVILTGVSQMSGNRNPRYEVLVFRYNLPRARVPSPNLADLLKLPDHFPVYFGQRRDFSDKGAHRLYPVNSIRVLTFVNADDEHDPAYEASVYPEVLDIWSETTSK